MRSPQRGSPRHLSRTIKGGGISVPPLVFSGSGPALVAGNAWTLEEDLAAARAAFGDLPVIGVNGALGQIRVDHAYSHHPARFISHRWLKYQKVRFDSRPVVHASSEAALDHVDHVWPDAAGGGGSAWGARKVAWLLGYDPVIMVGAPLTAGKYAGHVLDTGHMHREHVVNDLRAGIVREVEWHEGAFSASGWTAEFLGGLEEALSYK